MQARDVFSTKGLRIETQLKTSYSTSTSGSRTNGKRA